MNHPWNDDCWLRLTQPQARQAHALLFNGAEGLGKLALALRYARHLLGGDGEAERLFDVASHPDMHVLMPEAFAREGELAADYARRYGAPSRKTAKPSSYIVVDQVRQLVDVIGRHAHLATTKFVLIAPAERMNLNAANALLKMLEEPPSDTLFVLVSAHPEQLPATIRSRCMTVPFAIPPTDQAVAWVAAQSDGDCDRAAELLRLAAGAPLRALALAEQGFDQTRRQLLAELQGLCDGRSDPFALAGAWQERGLIGEGLRLVQGLLADLVRHRLLETTGSGRIDEPDAWLQETAKRIHLEKCFDLWDRIGTAIAELDGPLDETLIAQDTLIDLDQILQHDAHRRGRRPSENRAR